VHDFFMHHTKQEDAMREYQKGEIMLVVMVVMMAAVWLVSGHMDMIGMGHGAGHDEKPMGATPTAESSSAASAIPAASPEHPH
jgi:hypothetical protein